MAEPGIWISQLISVCYELLWLLSTELQWVTTRKHFLLIRPETTVVVITAFCQLSMEMNFYLVLCREAYCVNSGTFKHCTWGNFFEINKGLLSLNMTWKVYGSCRIISLSLSTGNEYLLCSPSFYLILNKYINFFFTKITEGEAHTSLLACNNI